MYHSYDLCITYMCIINHEFNGEDFNIKITNNQENDEVKLVNKIHL